MLIFLGGFTLSLVTGFARRLLDPTELCDNVVLPSHEHLRGLRFPAADLLASFAMFDDDPARINGIEEEFAAVTPKLIQRTVQEYLRPTNRTILLVEPGADAQGAASAAGGAP